MFAGHFLGSTKIPNYVREANVRPIKNGLKTENGEAGSMVNESMVNESMVNEPRAQIQLARRCTPR